MTELREYKGVLHVHTAYSDSAGRMPYVLHCARLAGLDYVVVADHNSLRARLEGWEGWHDGLLLVIGVEITSRKGHALALGLDHCPNWRWTHPEDYLPQVRRLGGSAFIAHPERTNRGKLYREPQAWPNLQTQDYAGIEIWSYMHDWVESAYPFHLLRGIRDPDAGILGPHPAVLRAWDDAALRRHTAGIGALDAHELRLPVPRLKWSLLKVLPMDHLFRTVRTHVLAPAWRADAGSDIAALRAALVAGRAFVAYDWLADATGSRFLARRADQVVALMGDEIPAGAELEFAAAVPREAELVICRDGEPVARARSLELRHRDSRPGVYRL